MKDDDTNVVSYDKATEIVDNNNIDKHAEMSSLLVHDDQDITSFKAIKNNLDTIEV